MTDAKNAILWKAVALGATRSAKAAPHIKLFAEMQQVGANGHTLVFGSRRTGMSGQYDALRLTQDDVAFASDKAK